jgi:hypothetical protein
MTRWVGIRSKEHVTDDRALDETTADAVRDPGCGVDIGNGQASPTGMSDM